jgi:hypothetical protein
VQDHQTQGQSYGYLREPQAQAETRLRNCEAVSENRILRQQWLWIKDALKTGSKPGEAGSIL